MVEGTICSHGNLPLALRTPDARPGRHHGYHGDVLLSHQRHLLERRCQVLAETLRHQLRHGHRHGYHPRIRVWYQLEQLLMVRGRHLRRTIGRRGHRRLLHGIDLRGRDVLRMEQGLARFPPRLHLAHRPRRHHLCVVDPGGQRLDAVSRWLRVQPRHDASRDGFVLRSRPLTLCSLEVLSHRHLGVDCRRSLLRGRLLLVPDEETRDEACARKPQDWRHRRPGCLPARCSYRTQVGTGRCRSSAHETGCHGSALQWWHRCRPHCRRMGQSLQPARLCKRRVGAFED